MATFSNIVTLANKMEDPKFETLRPTGRGNSYLLLLFQSPTLFSYDGNNYFKLPENSIIVYTPNQCQAYKSDNAPFINSFLTFSADKSYFDGFTFPLGSIFNISSKDLLQIIKKIDHVSYVVNTPLFHDFPMQDISKLIDDVFAAVETAYNSSRNEILPAESKLSLFSLLRNELYLNPVENTVHVMAKKAGYSSTYFGITYKEIFGTKPIDDRQAALAQLIKKYLESTNYSLEKISEMCRIESVSHLIRLFKKHYGITPHQYQIAHCSKTDKKRENK